MNKKKVTKYNKEDIRRMITTNKRWTMRALVVLYQRQTEDEQETLSTKHDNGIGFNGIDAPFLSDLARTVMMNRGLSDKQIKAAQRIIGKYAGQLTEIANRRSKEDA